MRQLLWKGAAVIAAAVGAVMSSAAAPAAASGDFDSVTTWENVRQGGTSGTASGTASGADDGTFALDASLDDPVFTLDTTMPSAYVLATATKTFELAPGVYDITVTYTDVHGEATAMGKGTARAGAASGVGCPVGSCVPVVNPIASTPLVHSDDDSAPPTFDAPEVTRTNRVVVTLPTVVTAQGVAWAEVVSGGAQVLDGSLAHSFHGPATASVTFTGTIASITAEPAAA